MKNVTRLVLLLSIVASADAQRMGGMGSRSPIMKALDADGDGKLSAAEIDGAPRALRFLDEDGDGVLAGAELTTETGVAGRRRRGTGMSMGDWDMGFGRRRSNEAPGRIRRPEEVAFEDGTDRIADRATFKKLAYEKGMVMPNHRGLEFVKFQILDPDSEDPKLYYINTRTHPTHVGFMRAIGNPRGMSGMRGTFVFRPFLVAPDGRTGLYTFEFEFEDAYPFEKVAFAYRLITATSPELKGRLAYFPLGARARGLLVEEGDRYEKASIRVVLPEDLFAGIGFLPLHMAESYGRLRRMRPGERPGPRDIVLYEDLPNEMPRVAGVISATRQTPLSHVNLRAVQDDVPNAFIVGAARDEKIASLVGKYVHYAVARDGYTLREATVEEVNRHFAGRRPDEARVPVRDLTVREIRSLDRIGFGDAAAFGVKAANLATLRRLPLPEGMVPAGHAVPFRFYDAFMKHNDLHRAARRMRESASFGEADSREAALAGLRAKILAGRVPDWMHEALEAVRRAHPAGTRLRCRSSTNNEDLPGFSGAGLYDSFTHRPDEGALVNSIKQVWASL